jgi:hypothetical protein
MSKDKKGNFGLWGKPLNIAILNSILYSGFKMPKIRFIKKSPSCNEKK